MLDRLALGFGKKLPSILQTEATECGLASLAMIAGYYGYETDMATLRRRYPVSLKGATLKNLMKVAENMRFSTRPLKLDMHDLKNLRTPCILHWDFNHFVVLKGVKGNKVTIHDPATGIRTYTMDELSPHFTGVAMEAWPTSDFQPKVEKQNIRLMHLTGKVSGFMRSFSQILILSLALEVFTVVSPFFMQWVLDHVLTSNDRDLLTLLAIGFGTLMIFQTAVSAIRSWVMMYMGTDMSVQWQSNVFTHLLRLPTSYFEKRQLGDVVSRFGSIHSIQQTLTSSFMAAILDGVMTIITVVLMFVYSPTLSFITLGAMVLYALLRWFSFASLRQATEENIIHAAKQETHFIETVRGVKTIKLFQREEERRGTWLSLLINQINTGLKSQKLNIGIQTANSLLFGLEGILIIWMGAKAVMAGNFSVGALMAFNMYKQQFSGRVSSLIDKFIEAKMLKLQGERLADIVLHEPEEKDEKFGVETENLEPSIEVKDLSFKYAEHEPEVLKNVSFRINPGENVAIVGPSGGGKSTLFNLLLGVLPAEDNQILYGDKPIEQVGLGAVRNMVGTVLQDDVLFAGSISDNISFFDPQVDYAWVEECARLAAIHTDIIQMPMTYNTLVGDMGTVLSGGQKQRILLARALYKRPKILLLDEATSHLDIEREAMVNQAIQSLKITRVIIAHRPETIRSADRIIALVNGQAQTLDPAAVQAAAAQAQAAARPRGPVMGATGPVMGSTGPVGPVMSGGPLNTNPTSKP